MPVVGSDVIPADGVLAVAVSVTVAGAAGGAAGVSGAVAVMSASSNTKAILKGTATAQNNVDVAAASTTMARMSASRTSCAADISRFMACESLSVLVGDGGGEEAEVSLARIAPIGGEESAK